MSEHSANQSDQDFIIQLEIVPEEPEEEVADVDEVARSIVDHIRNGGYTVTPKYTGKMGGSPIFDIVMQGFTILHDNKELLATAAASLEFLAATLGLIKDHTERQEERKNRPVLVPTTVEITIPTTQDPWIIKAPNAEEAIKIVKELSITEPEKVRTITPHKAMQVKPKVARKRRHHHR